MPVDVDGFRAAFPEFSDITIYPSARANFWMNLAQKLLNKRRWGNLYEEGIYLFVAHYMTIEFQAANSPNGAGSIGAVTSESQSIGDTSYSQGYNMSAYANNGQMAATVYGQMYLDLVRIVGAGAVQL